MIRVFVIFEFGMGWTHKAGLAAESSPDVSFVS